MFKLLVGQAPGPFGHDASRSVKAFRAIKKDRDERRKRKNRKGPEKFIFLLVLALVVALFGYFLNGS